MARKIQYRGSGIRSYVGLSLGYIEVLYGRHHVTPLNPIMAPPSRLFKYEAFSARALQNLKEQVIYFGSPLQFNDPYDCALTPRIKSPSNSDIDRLRKQYGSDPKLPEVTREKFKTMPEEKLRELIFRTGMKQLQEGVSEFLSSNGVSCFSEVNDSLLMWSHYSDSGKGFCLEFRTDKSPFEKLHQVQYTTKMPEVDIVSILCGDSRAELINRYRTKAEDWRYEKEWRCIHTKAGTAFGYESEALTGVYLGADMPFSQFEIIAMVLAGQNDSVQLWQGFRSESEFKVEFRAVTYTTYLEARRLGLR